MHSLPPSLLRTRWGRGGENFTLFFVFSLSLSNPPVPTNGLCADSLIDPTFARLDVDDPMTYSRPDSMMVGSSSANSATHRSAEADWTSGSEQNDQQNGVEDAHETRQGTDSPPANGASHPSGNPPVCQNCGTSTTPLWRRNELGATLCNACGLFLKLHGRARPLNLKTDTIKSRNRVKSVQTKKKVTNGVSKC